MSSTSSTPIARRRPNGVTIETGFNRTDTPASVASADTAAPPFCPGTRQESCYSNFSMGTPVCKPTPLFSGRWADEEEGEEARNEWINATLSQVAPTTGTSSRASKCASVALDGPLSKRDETDVFLEKAEEGEEANTEEENAMGQKTNSNDSLAAATTAPPQLSSSLLDHISILYRHNPYNTTAGMDELHRCDCDTCSSAAPTPRATSMAMDGGCSPADSTSFGLLGMVSTDFSAPATPQYDGKYQQQHAGYASYSIGEGSSRGTTPRNAYLESPSASTVGHFAHHGGYGSRANSSSTEFFASNNASGAFFPASQSQDLTGYQIGSRTNSGAMQELGMGSRTSSYDQTAMTAQCLALPSSSAHRSSPPSSQQHQGSNLLKPWVPAPPPPRITGRILRDSTSPDTLPEHTDAVLMRILSRWYAKVEMCQGIFIDDENEFCPSPDAFGDIDQWVAAVGQWWHRHFEHAQKKTRATSPAAADAQSSASSVLPARRHHTPGTFANHASVPVPRSHQQQQKGYTTVH